MGSTPSEDVDPNGAVGTKQYLEYVNEALVDANGKPSLGYKPSPKRRPNEPVWAQGPSPLRSIPFGP